MSRLFDCFTFYNELDVLEMRLEELYPIVDRFIIVEGNKTFQGKPKPFIGHDNRERFEKYADKISWWGVGHHAKEQTTWEREHYQRNMIKNFLEREEMLDDDIVMISDVDEIPRRETVASVRPFVKSVQYLGLPAYFYAIDCRADYEHQIKILPYSKLKKTTVQEIRERVVPCGLHDAGWHFSYLGGLEFIKNKFRSFSHTEFAEQGVFDDATLAQRILSLSNVWDGQGKMQVVPINHRHPHAVREDRDRWRKYEWRELVSSFQS